MAKARIKIVKSPTKIIKRIEELGRMFKKDNTVKVGFPKGSNPYPDGTSVIMVAAVQEFGSPARGVPERSFMRTTVNSNKNKYGKDMAKISKNVVNGKYDLKKGLGLLGLTVQNDMQQKIRDIKSPPLKYREGNPLIDTGHMIQSITYEVGNINAD